MAVKRVIIVGGGVIGVCCAYFLSRRGAQVIVLERNEIGKGASYGNAGTIAPGHPPLNRPGRIKQALAHMLDSTSPLYIPPRWDPVLAKWLWTFRAHCTAAHVRSNMQVLGPMGHASRALFERMVSEEDLECLYRSGGYYEVCQTDRGLESARADATMIRDYDYRPEILSADTLRAREPALMEDTTGGVYHPEGATCRPYRFVLELVERVKRYGGTVLPDQTVVEVLSRSGQLTGVRTQDEQVLEADSVVLATGAYSLELIQRLGYRLPIQAGKGYHRDLVVPAGEAPPLSSACVLSERSVFCTPMGDVIRFAGTMEFSGLNHTLRRPRLEQLTTAARQYLHGVEGDTFRSEWCGLRPCTPDGLPIVGPVPGHHGVFVASGHAMEGLTLGPITGKLVSEYVLDGNQSMDIRALAVDRRSL